MDKPELTLIDETAQYPFHKENEKIYHIEVSQLKARLEWLISKWEQDLQHIPIEYRKPFELNANNDLKEAFKEILEE